MAEGVADGNRTEAGADGWVQFHDGTGWHDARFRVVRSTGQLVVESEDRPAAGLSFQRITRLDEIFGAPAGSRHVEVSVGDDVAMDAVWTTPFLEEVTAALLSTLEDAEPEPESEVEPEPVMAEAEPEPEPEPEVAEETVDEAVDPAADRAARAERSMRRARAGVIGALALIGCGAVVAGAIGLSNSTDPRTPTTVTVTTTVPAAVTSTTQPG